VILHSSSFVILSVHFIIIIRLKHSFTNTCSLLFIWLVVFQVSQAHHDTYFTFVLKIRTLTSSDTLGFFHTVYISTNTPLALLNSTCYVLLELKHWFRKRCILLRLHCVSLFYVVRYFNFIILGYILATEQEQQTYLKGPCYLNSRYSSTNSCSSLSSPLAGKERN